MNKNHSFVTVVFNAETDLLNLQARSMALYLSKDMVERIIVIDNSDTIMSDARKRSLIGQYGPLEDLVDVFHHSDVCDLPLTNNGWRNQQILKLKIAEQIQTERYVALDAKNHLVYPLQQEFLTAADGRARNSTYSYSNLRANCFMKRSFCKIQTCGL